MSLCMHHSFCLLAIFEVSVLCFVILFKSFAGASELLQSLYRLSSSLQGNGHKDSDLMLVESLIRNADFQKILIIHNKVQEVCCFKCPPTPVTTEAQDITQEVDFHILIIF